MHPEDIDNAQEVLRSDLWAWDHKDHVWHVGYDHSRDGTFVIDACPWSLFKALEHAAVLRLAGHYTEIFLADEV